jgi:hypothetical protein
VRAVPILEAVRAEESIAMANNGIEGNTGHGGEPIKGDGVRQGGVGWGASPSAPPLPRTSAGHPSLSMSRGARRSGRPALCNSERRRDGRFLWVLDCILRHRPYDPGALHPSNRITR